MKGRLLHSVIVAPPGTGSDRDKRISDEGRKALLVTLREDLDLRRGLSRDVFINAYCAPMRKQETWLSWIERPMVPLQPDRPPRGLGSLCNPPRPES